MSFIGASVNCRFYLSLLSGRLRCVQCIGLDGEHRVPREVEVWDRRWQLAVLSLQLEVSGHEPKQSRTRITVIQRCFV